ncbi:c-type cytochrome [Desulfopila sp. IMCC35008]|uniref:c-type cytochrome n=1 Tax=Desulfopila sp. IMCC35008 TaxID=2653858 RepID=UPI0013D67878|nr:c-type cytochrome [Desulfopila sp. IMCC35008]
MEFISYRKRIVTLAIIISSVVIILTQVAYSIPTGNPENGQRWYNMNNCSSCHGEKGRNGLAPDVAGLELGFGSFLKNLRKPDSVSKPTYSESEISKQDALDIYAWLKRNQ